MTIKTGDDVTFYLDLQSTLARFRFILASISLLRAATEIFIKPRKGNPRAGGKPETARDAGIINP